MSGQRSIRAVVGEQESRKPGGGLVAVLVGLFAGRSLAALRTPDDVKRQRWDDRQARRSERKASRRETRAGWGPLQWVLVVAVAVVVVVLIGR